MPGASPSPKVLATRRGPPRPVNLLTWAALRPNLGRTCRPCRATPSQALAVPCRACFRSLGAAARLPRRVRRRSRRRMGAITLRWHAGGTRGRLRGSRGQRQTDSAARHQAGRPGAASRIGRARGAQRRVSWYAGDLERTRRFDQIAINPRLFRTPRRIGSFNRIRSNGRRRSNYLTGNFRQVIFDR